MLFSFITTKPGSRHGPSIKNPRVYDALRRQGMSKSQAAAISNAQRKKALPFTLKANYGARAGQTIAGRLVRGSDGKFSGSGAPAPAPKPKKAPKPKRTEADRTAAQAQRAAERDKLRRDTRDAVLAELGIDPGASEALVMLANGEQPPAEAFARMGAVEAGLVEQARDGTFRMTPAGRQMLNAAERGDKGLAGDVISRSRDRIAEGAERAAKPPAGGGGGGKKKPEKPPKLPQRQTSQAAKPVGGGGGGAKPPTEKPEAKPTVDPALAALAQRLSAGETLTEEEQDALVRNGLARMTKGEIVLTQAGSRATRGKSFSVYKDASGRLRWVAYSSNAYQDRDREIVSTKALTEDCARADATRAYGPLRWWHVPGWELGECDFNAMHGRVLVESGTFKSDAIALAISQAAPSLQLSIGFTHAPDEPDRAGVFHHIQRFERSLVPSGRAANPFTRLIVKETRMDKEKETALKGVLGEELTTQVITGAEQVQKDADDRQTAFKSADDLWTAVGAQLAQTLKAAVQSMIAPAAESVTEKALDDIPEEAKADVMVEEAVVDPAAVEEEPGDMTYDEFIQAIRAVVREEMAAEMKAQFSPLAAGLDIEKKVSSAVQSLMQPYQAQKDASDAERAEEIATLKATIAEQQQRLEALDSDLPAAFRPYSGFRASEAPETVITKEAAARLGEPIDADPELTKLTAFLTGIGLPAQNGHTS